MTDPSKWVIHGERLVDDTSHVRVSLADVELPNHMRFTQYVFRMRRCAMTVVLDDAGDRVLLMRRHRRTAPSAQGVLRDHRGVPAVSSGIASTGRETAGQQVTRLREQRSGRPDAL